MSEGKFAMSTPMALLTQQLTVTGIIHVLLRPFRKNAPDFRWQINNSAARFSRCLALS